MQLAVATASRPRPGYVYALENPALPGLIKVGHTHRPPHRRAAELSRTAVPLPFEVSHARFFWNAPGVEAALHRWFAAHRRNRRREFFELPLDTIAHTMDAVDHSAGLRTADMGDHEHDAPFAWRVADPDWGVSFEGLEEQWGWAEDEIQSRDPATVRQGWSRMEALSASGWDEGTWRLAEAMMRRSPTEETAHRAAWVLEAASCQGHPAAALRASWLRSFWNPEEFEHWKGAVDTLEPRLAGQHVLSWHPGIRETLETEVGLWPTRPDRRLTHDLFTRLSASATTGLRPR